jgi:hypothetical protein
MTFRVYPNISKWHYVGLHASACGIQADRDVFKGVGSMFHLLARSYSTVVKLATQVALNYYPVSSALPRANMTPESLCASPRWQSQSQKEP